MSEQITLMYMFFSDVEADSDEDAYKKTRPIFRTCQRFAKSIGVNFMFDINTAFEGSAEFRIVFDIKGTENSVLEKVSVLFGFAALHKFRFGNQFYYPKKVT